ncbi:MAG: serine/threonine protein kinase [Lentisphaerales bacterium]|jgi:serine/threonine protein kinase|nr:MAG: serine/threonine protein kinase [Lentisphaerales bacterium]
MSQLTGSFMAHSNSLRLKMGPARATPIRIAHNAHRLPRSLRSTARTGKQRIRTYSPSAAAAANRLPAFFSSRYKLVKPIGKGGMGIVYKAFDKVLNIDVAIKFLPERLTRNKVAISRFRREASTAMQLSHENILKLHNLEVDRHRMFLIMEFVDGRDMRRILQHEGAFSESVVVQIVGSCASAMDYAHERGIVHRDLKPENLMLNQNFILKLVDFGTVHTVAGSLKAGHYIEGSPPYISPEQIVGTELDARCDVYSLGVMAYEFLAGHPPFDYNASLETLVNSPVPELEGVPEAFVQPIYKALEKNPDDRWQTAGEFFSALADVATACGIDWN